jgi:cytochrome c oxidase assembly protein subunit 15
MPASTPVPDPASARATDSPAPGLHEPRRATLDLGLPLLAPARASSGLALLGGWSIAVAMWMAWFIAHLPAFDLSPRVTGPFLVSIHALGGIFVGLAARRRGGSLGRAALVGAGAGLVTGAVNLLLVGSKVVTPSPNDVTPQPGAGGLLPAAPVMLAGYMLTAAVLTALGAGVGALLRRAGTSEIAGTPVPRTEGGASADLPAFAFVAAVCFLPLLLIGGLVTSAQSGLAVPDWPGTFGANMFLYPLALMADKHVFLEHTHRLFGAFVGLTTMVLMAWTLIDRRPGRHGTFVKTWAVAIFVLVCIQGYIGGRRVTDQSQWLAALHGVSAQAIFAMAVALAIYLSGWYRRASEAGASPDAHDRRRRAFATGLLHALFLQLMLGAMYRHTGSTHPLWAHVGFSIVIVGLAVTTGFLFGRRPEQGRRIDGVFAGLGLWLLISVALQFLMGWAALWVALTYKTAGVVPTADQLPTAETTPMYAALIRTAHQAHGALLIGLATACAVVARQVWRSRRLHAGALVTAGAPTPGAQPGGQSDLPLRGTPAGAN